MAAAPTLGPITAVQAMTPALERTKQQLFLPFRFSHWWRLALTSLLAGTAIDGRPAVFAAVLNVAVYPAMGFLFAHTQRSLLPQG